MALSRQIWSSWAQVTGSPFQTFAYAIAIWLCARLLMYGVVGTGLGAILQHGLFLAEPAPDWDAGGYLVGFGAVAVSLFLATTIDDTRRTERFDASRALPRIMLEAITAGTLWCAAVLTWMVLLTMITSGKREVAAIALLVALAVIFSALKVIARPSPTALRYSMDANQRALDSLGAERRRLEDAIGHYIDRKPRMCWSLIVLYGAAVGLMAGLMGGLFSVLSSGVEPWKVLGFPVVMIIIEMMAVPYVAFILIHTAALNVTSSRPGRVGHWTTAIVLLGGPVVVPNAVLFADASIDTEQRLLALGWTLFLVSTQIFAHLLIWRSPLFLRLLLTSIDQQLERTEQSRDRMTGIGTFDLRGADDHEW